MTPGTTLGRYEIVSLIGSGGMGEVYRARDIKLKRDVALKVLTEALAGNADHMARFQREAELLASLNHPHIAHIHGLEEADSIRALVMELVDGPTLADRIAQGPIAIDEALPIAKQIAEALEAAHEQGIIHRDLKPANVKVRDDGTVKVLDFGLAKVLEPAVTGVAASVSASPTITSPAMTHVGVILGTAAYMAPEQAKGKPADKRSDIWAFGCVLYEMLTGRRAFEGDDVSDTLANVLKAEPDWSALPAATPTSIRTLVRRCLTKEREQRLQAIGEARIVLQRPQSEEPAVQLTVDRRQSRLVKTLAAATVVLIAAFVAVSVVALKHVREGPSPIVKLDFQPPQTGAFPPQLPTVAVSPDGRRLAFEAMVRGQRTLWVRDLDAASPRMLAELEAMPELPFWAPDGRRLAFFAGSKLKSIDVNGGPAFTIADTGVLQPSSGSWNRDDVIIFGRINSGLFRVPAKGGSPVALTTLDKTQGETGHGYPWFLPDGRHFLYLVTSRDREKSGVFVGDLRSKTSKRIAIGNTRTIYVNPGYLLFVRDRTLLAQPFDASSLDITGDAAPVVEDVDAFTFATGGPLGHFSASQNGVLAYTTGGTNGAVQLTWFDGSGKKRDPTGVMGVTGSLQLFSLSPDGRSVAYARQDSTTGNFDVWTRDLVHGNGSRLTSTGTNMYPIWSADGTDVFFMSNRNGQYSVIKRAANGSGTDHVVETAREYPMDVSRDGQYLFTVAYGDPDAHIRVHQLNGDRKSFPYPATPFNENRPRLSPNGHWLVYQSDESKRSEVYVVSFPERGKKYTISTDGGRSPVWRPDGGALYYYSPDDRIMSVEIVPGTQFQYGVPKPQFAFRMPGPVVSFEVSKEGYFLLPTPVNETSPPMTVFVNWPEALKRK
jgi:serine/threonine protein kinase/Tol biopolymer transport system component